MTFNTADHPHRRRNPLTGQYVLVSPHRTKRPWQGQVEKAHEHSPAYDETCYLCPGNERAGGKKNPVYTDTFVFRNDFAALLEDTPEFKMQEDIFSLEAVKGTCRVICFSPRHDLSLAEMELAAIRKVVELWVEQLWDLRNYTWVQIFETKGAITGSSNSHPHGQIWATSFLPNEAVSEDYHQQNYFAKHGSPLLFDYALLELEKAERIVVEKDHWLVVVPYWAYWPFETLVLPKRHVKHLSDLSEAERHTLADILKRMLTRFDNLFETSFPYCSGWHGAPRGMPNEHWQLHAHYFPPLLRSASVQKFVASYEWLAEAQRDLTAEQAAKRLRELSDIHYKKA